MCASLLFRSAIAAVAASCLLDANPSNPALRKTGAPGDGSCRECHIAAIDNAGSVVVVFNRFSYTPGQKVGVKVVFRSARPASNTALQMTARLTSNPLVQAGHFEAASPLTVAVDNGIEYVNQLTASAATEYSFDWTAPSTNVGDVLFYVAGVVGESNGTPEGNVYQRTFRLRTATADLPTGLRSTTFSIPGSGSSIVTGAISNNGQVTGSYYDGTRRHGYVRPANGTVVTFDAQSTGETHPAGINNAGRIVGSTTSNSKTSGFIREPGGGITLFDVPGATSTSLAGINDAGLIVGTFTDSANVTHGLTMTTPNDLQIFDVGAFTNVTSVSSTGTIGGTTNAGQALLGGIVAGFLRFSDGTSTVSLAPCTSGTRGGGAFAIFSNALQTVLGNCGANSSGMIFQSRFIQAPNGASILDNIGSNFSYYGGINDSGQMATTLISSLGIAAADGVILTPCTASTPVTAVSAPSTSGNITIPVQSQEAGCRALATDDEAFLGVSSVTDTEVSVFVSENTSASPRTGRVWVAGTQVTVTQAGIACTLTLIGGPATFASSGGSGTITITGPAGCPWNATSNASWITLTGNTSGVGAGSVTFSVAANTSQSVRNSAITIGTQQFSIIQSGPACVYTVDPQSLQFSQSAGTATLNVTTTAGCSWNAIPSEQWITVPNGNTIRSGSGSITVNVAANSFAARAATISIYATTFVIVSQSGAGGVSPLRFIPVAPCRVADTRVDGGKSGAFGPPRMQAGETRTIPVTASSCGIPLGNVRAYSLNITVVPLGPLSFLTTWPGGEDRPLVSTLNSFNGRVVANAAIVPAGASSAISLYVTDPTDVVIDINGYFVTSDIPQGLAFYPVTPCRVADTRNGSSPITGQTFRSFNVPASGCGIPSTAQAYAMNATVVPPGYLGFLTLWPSGQTRPNASTLNSWDGQVVANMAIVPAGTNGAVSAYAANDTDLVLDITGYFAPAGQPGALNFYTRTPCRIADTRNTTIVPGQTSRSFAMGDGGCVPADAKAYSVNVTAVPPGYLGFLTTWPTGVAQPFVSTLNSWNGQVVANAALVPAGTGGAVSVYVSNPSHVIIDANGYFAP